MSTIKESIIVDVPVNVAYNQWTQFEEFPRFMEGIISIKQLDDTHLHWHADIAGKEKEWDAEIVEQVPDQRIGWRSTSIPNNNGLVTFQTLDNGRTQVTLQMDYAPEGLMENIGDALGFTTRRIKGDLERFKQFIESRGQESGAWRGEVHGGDVKSAGGQQAASSAAGQQASSGREIPVSSGQRASSGRQAGAGSQAASALASARGEQLPSLLRNENPFTMMRRLFDDMDRLFEGFGLGGGTLTPRLLQDLNYRASQWMPHMEVSERDGQLVVCAELPGVDKDNVKIEIDQDRLTIEGERRQERQEGRGGYHLSERRYGSFYRSIPLPEGVKADQARASLNNGVLEITLPLSQQPTARRIEIQSGSSA
ncbi:MAG: Hsp20 family protein [Candidatus Competibacteraceae bacterium]